MKRKTALFLAGICLVSLLSGCGSKESAENTDIKDPAPALTREEADSEESNAQPGNDSSNKTDEYYMVNGKSPEEVTGNILFWSWDPNFFDMVEKMNTIYPNVTFDFVTVASADDYMQKLQAALTSGSDVPDILAMEINNLGKFYDMGICENLD